MDERKNKSKEVGNNKKALADTKMYQTMLFYVYSHQNIKLPR